ncbi:MAG: hypothetical protein KDH09_05380 [Chrysiogenetes bacterium]|nr:hypothetical protein [Chrysiogenetes bacterium]
MKQIGNIAFAVVYVVAIPVAIRAIYYGVRHGVIAQRLPYMDNSGNYYTGAKAIVIGSVISIGGAVILMTIGYVGVNMLRKHP